MEPNDNPNTAGLQEDSSLQLFHSTSVGDYAQITFGYQNVDTTYAPAYMGFVGTNSGAYGYGDLVFGTRTGTDGNSVPTERMRIMSDGKVGIGCTDTHGGLLAVETSGSAAAQVNCLATGTGTAGVLMDASDGDATGNDYLWVAQTNDLKANFYLGASADMLFSTAATVRCKILANGDFYTHNGAVYDSSSDIRTKKEVTDLTDGLSMINQLRPVSFKYNGKSEFHEDDGRVFRGLIADELKEVAPHYVVESKGLIDGVEVEDFKTLSTTTMIPMMMKAIQELSAKVTALEAA